MRLDSIIITFIITARQLDLTAKSTTQMRLTHAKVSFLHKKKYNDDEK